MRLVFSYATVSFCIAIVFLSSSYSVAQTQGDQVQYTDDNIVGITGRVEVTTDLGADACLQLADKDTAANAACICVSSDRLYHDTDCDATKDAGEEFIDLGNPATTATALAADGANCAAGEIALGVDTAGAVQGCYEPVEADISDLSHTADEVGTLTTGDLCINDGSVVNCTVNTEAELETALDALDVITVTTDDITTANLMDALSDEGAGTTYLAGDGTWDDVITEVELDTKAELHTQITDVSDFAEADGDTYAGVHDFGGATSLEIPNGTNPTVNAAGEIAHDTTADQLVYGATPRVLTYEQPLRVVIENLAAADDDIDLGSLPYAVTITQIGCHCKGTCTTAADISLEDRAGNAMTHTVPTCSTGSSNTTFQNVTAANTLVAGEGLRFDVDNAVSPETDEYAITIMYVVDRQ